MSEQSSRSPFLQVSELARRRIQKLMGDHGTTAGLRIALAKGGCSGLVYEMEMASVPDPADEVLDFGDNVRIFVAATAVMFLINARLDLHHDDLQERFVLNNPNEKARCGCGQSFFV